MKKKENKLFMVKRSETVHFGVCICALFRHCFCTMMKETHSLVTSHATTNTLKTKTTEEKKKYTKKKDYYERRQCINTIS